MRRSGRLQVDHDEASACQEDQGLHHWVAPVGDVNDQEAADAVQGEHIFGDDEVAIRDPRCDSISATDGSIEFLKRVPWDYNRPCRPLADVVRT